MVVYGVALLSFCMLAGVFLGRLLGYLLGIDANVGGIGIAMLLLIFIANKKSTAIKIDASNMSEYQMKAKYPHGLACTRA